MVDWDTICKPKQARGLGLRDPKVAMVLGHAYGRTLGKVMAEETSDQV